MGRSQTPKFNIKKELSPKKLVISHKSALDDPWAEADDVDEGVIANQSKQNETNLNNLCIITQK